MLPRYIRSAPAIIAGAAASLIFMSPPALAQDGPIVVRGPEMLRGPDWEGRIQRVSYRDLNLLTFEGQRMLHERVGTAVRRVCMDASDRLTETHDRECMAGAWRSAQPQMNYVIRRAHQYAAYNRR
jgi:UrcA family protein